MGSGAGFRRARRGEAERIGEIARAAYSVYEPRIGVRPAPLDADYVAIVRSQTAWVAEGSPLDGFIVLEPRPDHLWVANVAVDPARQGRGLGRALLDFAERRAAELGLGVTRLLTSVRMVENIALYERLGYEREDVRFEEGRERLYLRKALQG